MVLLAAAGGLWYYFAGGGSAPAGQPPLLSIDTSNFAQVRAAFNDAKSSVRVIAMLSPT